MVLIKNKIKIITLIFFCLFCFTGCWDKFEPEERGFVTAMGIDKNSNGEFNISLEVPETSMFKENSGGSSSEKETENSHTETSSGSAIWSVVKDIDSKTDRRLDFGQIKVCVIGEAILKDKNLFKQTMDALERNKDIWRKVLVCTTKGRAEDILKGYTGERKTVGFFVTSYFNNNKKNTDSTLNKDLQEVLIELSMSGNTVLPLVFLNEGEIIFDGMSIINDYSFSGYGKNEIMKGYNIIKEDIEETEIVADIMV